MTTPELLDELETLCLDLPTRERKQAREIISQLRERVDWRDISTAPKDGTHILVALIPPRSRHPGFVPVREAYWSRRKTFWMVAGMTMVGDNLTHWMPLPSPPTPSESKLK